MRNRSAITEIAFAAGFNDLSHFSRAYSMANGQSWATSSMSWKSPNRILTRFGGTAEATEKRSRGRRARIAPAAGGRSRARGGQQAPTLSMSDGILKAVQAHGDGITANEVLDYLSREFGMTVRPNHPGIALQRHRRAGRLENRDQRWYLPASAQSEQ